MAQAAQIDLFGDGGTQRAAPAPASPYRDGIPGWKRAGTSQDAAEGIAPKAMSLRARVFEALKAGPGTPEEIAARLNEPVMNIRPRCSELAARCLIEDSEERGKAMGGRRSIRWRVAVKP